MKFEENKLLIQGQLLNLMSITEKSLTSQHFSICTIDTIKLCISITLIKKDVMYFESYYLNNKIKTKVKKHKVNSNNFIELINRFIDQIPAKDMINCQLIELQRIPKPQEKPQTVSIIDQQAESGSSFKRNNKHNRHIIQDYVHETIIKSLANVDDDKPIAITKQEKAEAQLERKIFSDQKMWKWQTP